MSSTTKTYVIAFLLGLAGASMWSGISKDLEMRSMLKNCRTETGAYECVIKAVPVAQPDWVRNGERK